MAEKIHFIGIGGVGMAGLAALLKARGHEVSGCDLSVSARTKWLESLGIPVSIGHNAAHLDNVDLAVVTPAVPKDNAEFVRAGIRARYRGEVLASVVNSSRGVAVCGTHGKTTTATFAAKLLRILGDEPSWCIGGETGSMPVAGADGKGPLVVEADESDGTLALYRPEVLVFNACDFDHLEHFKSVEDYFDCYRKVLSGTKREVIVCADHPKALELAHGSSSVRVTTFGFDPSADITAADWPSLQVPGRHNILNALAAIAVARSFGHSDDEIRAALPNAVAELPDRRFELVVETEEDVRIYTDYAHHPAELKCAVEMARSTGQKRLRVIFQPHRHSRTKALLEEFPPAFAAADEVVLVPVYAAFEKPVPGGDIADLYRTFRHQSKTPVILARDVEEAWKHVLLTLAPGDTVLIAGAGDIIHLVPRIQNDLSAAKLATRERFWKDLSKFSFFRTGGKTCGGGKPVVVGMGSNTWFSDCATDDEIVKPDLPAGASLLKDHPELSFMAGIPGTVGGWVKMNAGAHGDEIGNYVEAVKLSDGRVMTHDDCAFAYRSSKIEGVITEVRFKPSCGVDERPKAEEYLAKRKAFPPRCCGSVFKNPPGDYAGRLLDEVGAKSMNCGGAYVWKEHANVIVAGEKANSSDIMALARIMALAVKEKFGITLEPEIKGLVI